MDHVQYETRARGVQCNAGWPRPPRIYRSRLALRDPHPGAVLLRGHRHVLEHRLLASRLPGPRPACDLRRFDPVRGDRTAAAPRPRIRRPSVRADRDAGRPRAGGFALGDDLDRTAIRM